MYKKNKVCNIVEHNALGLGTYYKIKQYTYVSTTYSSPRKSGEFMSMVTSGPNTRSTNIRQLTVDSYFVTEKIKLHEAFKKIKQHLLWYDTL